METAQRTLGWCPTVKENKLFSFLLFLSCPNLVSSQKLSQERTWGSSLGPGVVAGSGKLVVSREIKGSPVPGGPAQLGLLQVSTQV